MPNKDTFKIKPIKELLDRIVVDGKGWVDPFAGFNSPAEITNDLNPNVPAMHHKHAFEFCEGLDNHKGALFDPPYSLRQVKECYASFGISMTADESRDASFSKVKNILANKVDMAISFGWNSNGFGKNRGFEIVEILLVPHGGHHNDTIVVVEKKLKGS
jgi:hypothetical protein